MLPVAFPPGQVTLKCPKCGSSEHGQPLSTLLILQADLSALAGNSHSKSDPSKGRFSYTKLPNAKAFCAAFECVKSEGRNTLRWKCLLFRDVLMVIRIWCKIYRAGSSPLLLGRRPSHCTPRPRFSKHSSHTLHELQVSGKTDQI